MRHLAHWWELATLWHLRHLAHWWEESLHRILLLVLLKLLLLLFCDQQFWVCLEVTVLCRRQQLGLTVDERIDGLVAKHTLTQLLVALLHSLAIIRVLQQTLPQGWRRVIAAALVAPRLRLVGIGQIAVAVGIVVIPHRPSKKLTPTAVGLLFLLIEISTAPVGIGIKT